MKFKETIIKSLSLGTGLAIGMILIAKVCFEMSYDGFYKDLDRVYWIYSNAVQPGQDAFDYNQCSGAIAQGFSNFTDTCFFDVFDRDILAGDPHKALGEWGSLMVSRSFAEKMGGIENIIGKQICNIQLPELKLTINGVYEDFPENGTFPYDVLMSLETYSRQSAENWVGNDRYRAFSIIHTSDPHVRNMMFILSLVAFLLLAISVMNYVLIAISAIVKRSKDVGVRKAYGAEVINIYGLLFKETAVNMGLSLIVAAAIIYAAKPVIENLLGVSLIGLMIPQTIITLTIVCVMIFMVSAIVPGYLYAKIPVSAALKNYKENRRNWKKALLLVQFVINVFLVAMMLVIAKQYQKVMNDDPGYEFENLVGCSFDSMTSNEINRFVEKVSELPEVIDVERSYDFPAGGASGNNIYLSGGQYMELFNVADQYFGTDGFFDILEIPFIDGRAPRSANEVAVSRSFVDKMMDFQDWSDGAVGKQILVTEHSQTDNQTFTISGVYENYRIGTMNGSDPRPSIKFWEDANEENSYSMPLKLVIIAILIGDICAWVAAESWLKQFAEKIALTPWYFLASDIIVTAIIIGAVVMNCLRISRSNPVESLKNE